MHTYNLYVYWEMEDGGESTEFNVQLAGIFRNIHQTRNKQGARNLTFAFALCLLSADYGMHTLLPLKNSFLVSQQC